MRPDRGFTLLELLVALVVFGMLMAGLGQTVRFGLAAWRTQTRQIDRTADLDGVERVLRGVIAGIAPGRANDPPNIVGTAASFAFTSELPEGAGPEASRTADILLRVDGAHRLVLQWTPHLHVAWVGRRPDPTTTDILAGLDRLELSYWTADAGWRGEWRERSPPDLVRVRLRFPSGDGRRWPDIVAAPQRRRADG